MAKEKKEKKAHTKTAPECEVNNKILFLIEQGFVKIMYPMQTFLSFW